MKNFLILLSSFFFFSFLNPIVVFAEKEFIYIGTNSSNMNHAHPLPSGSKGIYVAEFDTKTCKVGRPRVAAEAKHPIWLVLSPERDVLYAGLQDGFLSSYTINKRDGSLTLLNTVPSDIEGKADGATHAAIGDNGKFIYNVNYITGSAASFRLLADGSIGEQTGRVTMSGSGPHFRQKNTHPHCIVLHPDQRHLLIPDLGTDKVMAYLVDPETGAITADNPPFISRPAGSGPRHGAFSPDGRFFYLVDELTAKLVIYSWNGNSATLRFLEEYSTVPTGFSEPPSGSAITIDKEGNFLYFGSRSDSTILVYKVDKKSGYLSLVQRMPAQGKLPWAIAFDPTENFCLVANRWSNQVVVLFRDKTSGKLKVLENQSFDATIDAPQATAVVAVKALM